jgi:hypothetical protein
MIVPQQETQQREKEQQAIKEKQNRKEFRKWNRLHRNNKYRSMVSGTSILCLQVMPSDRWMDR